MIADLKSLTGLDIAQGLVIMSTLTPSAHQEVRSPSSIRGEAVTRELQLQLDSTRKRLIRQKLAVGIFLTGTILAISIILCALVDYFCELDGLWRIVWFLGSVAISLLTVLIVGRKSIHKYDLSQTAIETESRLVQFGQRLRTSIDYEHGRPLPANATPALLAALHQETHRIANDTEWEDAIDHRPLFISVSGFVIIAVTWLAGLLLVPEFRIASARAFAFPAEYTSVTYSPQQVTVRFGQTVTVKADVVGRPIKTAHVRYRPWGTQAPWTFLELKSDLPADTATESGSPNATDVTNDFRSIAPALVGLLTARFENLQNDLEFEVLAGPRVLTPGKIRVLQPLTIKKGMAQVTPPVYTRRSTEVVKDANELRVLEGSRIDFTWELNRQPAEARLVRIPDSTMTKNGLRSRSEKSNIDSTSVSEDIVLKSQHTQISGHLSDVRSNASYHLIAKAADGIALDPVRINIRVKMDQKPQIEFLQPSEELVVTPSTEVYLQVSTSDDLGLHKIGIMYQIGSGKMETLLEEDRAGDQSPYQMDHTMLLEKFSLTQQDSVNYFAFAEDNYFGKPRRVVTPLRFIDIRPYKIAYQIIDSNCSCKGCSVTLEELITRQRQTLSQTFAVQEQKNLTNEIASRLGTAEKEILEATTELAEGLKDRGADVLSLDFAVRHLEKAVSALETENLKKSLVAEQDALTSLIRARENVRKMLNQSSNPSASACRKFDRQQKQKLRLPEKKQQDQQQQLAQARAKLEEIAKQERKWSDQVKSCPNPNSNSPSNRSSTPKSPSEGAQQTPKQSSSSSAASQNPTASKTETAQNSPMAESERQSASPSLPKESQPMSQGTEAKDPDLSPEGIARNAEQEGQPTASELAQKQALLRAELAQVLKDLEGTKPTTPASRELAKQAARGMEQAIEELEHAQSASASDLARASADQLQQLSQHLANINTKDFGQRLDQAQKLARNLAARQRMLAREVGPEQLNIPSENLPTKSSNPSSASSESPSGSGQKEVSPAQSLQGTATDKDSAPSAAESAANRQENIKPSGQRWANDQAQIAAETDLLGELLQVLSPDASLESMAVRQSLEQIQAENPPSQISNGMRQTADDLKDDNPFKGRQGVHHARRQLDELSESLAAAHSEFSQPQLKELLALEDQLAQLMQQLKRGGATGQSNIAEKWENLAQRLEKMATSDKRLQDALHRLAAGPESGSEKTQGQQSAANQQGSQAGGSEGPSNQSSKANGSQSASRTGVPIGQSSGSQIQSGELHLPDRIHGWTVLQDSFGVKELSKVLQMKIQEAILAGALQDADQPVPPAYKELVEEYYRSLSDDLR